MDVVFAIPGDMMRRTGGFIYESTVLRELRGLGHDVTHLRLPDGFPDPSGAEIERTRALLAAVSPATPILLDGFIPACIGAGALSTIPAPIVPIIHHPLGLETGLPEGRARELLTAEAAALARVPRIVVPSPHTKRILVETFALEAGRIDIAPPGFDRVTSVPVPTTPPTILSVGLLAARKGHDVLLDALSQLVDLDWRARIVGGTHDPAVADALFLRARDPALAGRVTFTGPVSDADLRAEWDATSIFALATRYEGYGMVFGDAMLRGLPIVSCASGAVPDTVGDAARLVPPDDPAAFADALRGLLTDAQARADLSDRSARRGATLPRWRDTAACVARAVASVRP